MRLTITQSRRGLLAGIIAVVPFCAGLAADTATTSSGAAATQSTAAPAPVVTAAPAPVKLPYGVEDVLKLSRAQISESIILNYVQGSGTIYNLGPKDIVYLRDQGVTQPVITAMLDQRKRVEMIAGNAAGPAASTATAANVVSGPDANTAPFVSTYSDPNATTYATAPLTPPASSVYVIPYQPGTYPYYGPYGYSPYYYGGWYGPSVSFGFGFGGHGYYGGHYYGGHGSFGHGGGGHGGHGGHR